LIVHTRRLHDELRLEKHIGMAGSLAADNERLRAEQSAHLEDLRLARSRIVAAADDQRRRLERDLHDSAQQRLLAVGYDVRLAESAARSAHDEALAARLAGAGEDVTAVLAALRRLARGIYPAILDEAGLGPALETLGDLAPVPMEIRAVPAERLPPPVALAIYLLVDGTLQRAATAGGSHIVVEITHEGGHVTAEIASDTALEVPVTLQDRLGALGGRALVGERDVHAEVPCG
jgi:signal transduction histidine kinase